MACLQVVKDEFKRSKDKQWINWERSQQKKEKEETKASQLNNELQQLLLRGFGRKGGRAAGAGKVR